MPGTGRDTDLKFQPAESGDVAFLLQLEEDTMRRYAEALWGGWRPSTTADAFDLAGHYIVVENGVQVGCVAFRLDSAFLSLIKLYIAPEHQGRGLGAQALRWANSHAARDGLITQLSVLTSNPARRFYEREGFTVASETQDRIWMEKDMRGGSTTV